MKLVTYSRKGSQGIGVLLDGVVMDLLAAHRAACRASGKSPMTAAFADMLSLLDAGPKAMAAAKQALRYAEGRLGTPPKPDGKMAWPLSGVRLCAPVPKPRKVLALAGNYAEHIMEGGRRLEQQDKETPRVFMKPPTTAVTGPGDPIVITPVSKTVDYEGEMAIVIGRRAKHVKSADGMKYVAGFTCLNDVSERRLVIRRRSEDRPQDKWFDWLNGKWLDSFAPTGPCLATLDEVGDPHRLHIQTRVNGEVRQSASTGQMIFHAGDIIEYISAIVTLEPGDLISTGTPAGVGATTETWLKPGDVVEVEIEKIGVLRNVCKAGA